MPIRPILAIVLRQYYLIRSSIPRMISLFIWIGVDLLLWGYISRYLGQDIAPSYNFVTVLLGAVLLWDILIRIMQGVTMGYMEDSWTRNLFNLFVSPLSVGSYLIGLVIASILTSIIVLVIMTGLAGGLFGLSFLSYGLSIFPFMSIIFLTGIALGILGCSFMLRLGPSAEWLVWPIPAVISPFTGVFYPLSTLPDWMQAVGHLIPTSYVFENIRQITNGGAASATDMIIGLTLAAFYLLASCLFFFHVFRRALKVGSIARYSGENF